MNLPHVLLPRPHRLSRASFFSLGGASLEFYLPETVLRSRDDFCRWYAGGGDLPGVVNIFFDEQHVLSRVDASRSGDVRMLLWSSIGRPTAGSRRRRAANGLVSMPTKPGRWCGPPPRESPSSSVT